MSQVPTTTPFLKRIGLSEDEQKVLLSLLALGPLSAGEISRYTGIKPISKIRGILENLFSKNYAYNIDGLVDKAIGLYPFREIAEEAGKDSAKINQLVAELKQYVADQIKHFDQVMKETEDFVRAEKVNSTEKITKNSEANRTAISTKLKESTTTISTNVDATKKKIKTETDDFLVKQTEAVETFETNANGNLDDFATSAKSKSNDALQQMSSTIKAKNETFLTEGTNTLEKVNKSIIKHADELSSILKDSSKEKLETTRDHVLFGLESFVTETEGNVSTLSETLTTATDEQATFIKETTEEAKKNRIDLNNQLKDGVAGSFDKVKEDFAADLNGFEDKFNKQLEKIANKFKKQIDELNASTAEEIKGLIENANATINDLTAKHNEEIATNVDIDTKAVEDGTSAMIAKVEGQNSKALQTITASTDAIKSSTVLLKANYSADINTKVEDTITGMHSSIDSSVSATKSEYDTTKIAVVDKLSSLTNEHTNSSASTATNTIQEITALADTTVTTTKDSLKETKGTLMNSTKKTKQKVATDATGSVDTVGTTATTTLNEMSTQATTGIRNSEETSISTIGAITDVVETSVRKEIESVKGGFNDYYNRFSKDALKISQLLKEFKNQNEAFQTDVSTYPRPIVETAILYSKDAVFDRLDDMLTQRIKSNVTMVIPDPIDIPTKTIGKVKPQAKMTIISKIDEINHKSIIDEINAVDSIGRTKIRKIGMQDMVGYSEYIAFDRDGGEEMLIAFKDETEKEWVGILSKSDGFKNVVIGETLGRQALSISRELK